MAAQAPCPFFAGFQQKTRNSTKIKITLYTKLVTHLIYELFLLTTHRFRILVNHSKKIGRSK